MANELIPREYIIKSSIEQGAVFYFKNDSFKGCNHKHYFIVLNIDPKKDEITYLVHAETISEINFDFANIYEKDTLVQVTDKKECFFVTHPTVFNCNDIQVKSYKDLEKKYKDGALEIKNSISSELLNKIIEATIKSNSVSEKIKIKIKPEYKSSLTS